MPNLAGDLASALDPVVLARRMGLEPDPWQARVLRSPGAQLILNCTRQAGKSTVSAVLVAHVALYEPRAPVCWLYCSSVVNPWHVLTRRARKSGRMS